MFAFCRSAFAEFPIQQTPRQRTNPTMSSSSSTVKPRRRATTSAGASSCNHAPSITLDLLLLLLILSSCAFLVFSSLSHILRSLSIFLVPLLTSPLLLLSILLILLLSLLLFLLVFLSLDGLRGRPRTRCQNPRCRGLMDAVEFDVKVQTEERVKGSVDEVWREIEELPWKGGGQGDNPDYECVRKELRRMAPVNGRAVLLFRARCGCPLAKLEGWGAKRGKRHKK